MKTKFWTGFASIEQLDSTFIQRLYNYFGDVETAWNSTLSDLKQIEGLSVRKAENFIEKKKGSSSFSFAFIYQNQFYGVWNDFKESKIYISNDYDPSSPYIYAVTTKDFRPNTLLIKSASKYRHWKFLLDNYKQGLVYFENQKIKKYSQDVFRMFLTS